MGDFDSVAVTRDIELVLAACLPADWLPASEEPKLVIGCVHPLKYLMVHMDTQTVVCENCNTRLSRDQVGYRLDRA